MDVVECVLAIFSFFFGDFQQIYTIKGAIEVGGGGRVAALVR